MRKKFHEMSAHEIRLECSLRFCFKKFMAARYKKKLLLQRTLYLALRNYVSPNDFANSIY